MRWGWHSRAQHIRRRLGLDQSIPFWNREVVRVHRQPEKSLCRVPSILSPTEILSAPEEIPARVDRVNAIWTSGQSKLRPVQLIRSIAPKSKLNIRNLGSDILRRTYIPSHSLTLIPSLPSLSSVKNIAVFLPSVSLADVALALLVTFSVA